MKVLVTGGSGFVGNKLIRALQQDGHEVFALARSQRSADELAQIGCQIRRGDINDVNVLIQSFEGMDSVFHLAGLIAYKKSEYKAMFDANVVGTQNVINACLKQKIRRLVYMSSVTAIGASFDGQQPLDENSKYNLTKQNLGYFETKRMAEEAVKEAVRNKGLDAVILNPSTIYGPADAKKSSRKTQVKVARGEFPFYTSGGVSIIHIDDAIAGVMSAWKNGRSGERYILCGENITIKKLFEIISEAAGVAAPRFLMPRFVLFIMGFVGDLLGQFGVQTGVSIENAWTSTLFHWFDNQKAKNELKIQIRPARDAIFDSVHWMKTNGLLQK